MSKYNTIDNYLIFKELNTDSIGTNYRAGEIGDNRAKKHVLLTEVYPYFYSNEDVWNRINTLLQGIKKSNIPNLYSPDKILRQDNRVLLIYPLVMGKTFEQILKDSTEKEVPINFDLAFSIAIAISDLIDIGSSIVVSGQKSFHGFLTPDNIMVDYDGKILLKNYGIYPYLGQNKEIFNEMENKYGTWLTPEFVRRDKILYQSDVYHLGYLVFRMLTGNYFAYNQNENFESKFANISFSHHIPHTEKDFLSNIIQFFKRTLNPDPIKRFSTVKEAKDYISNYFRIDELSSVTFSLAYFMNSLYLEQMEEEKNLLKQELAYDIPVEKEEIPELNDEKSEGQLVESILDGLEDKGKSKPKNVIVLASLFVVVIAIAIFFYISSSKKAKETQIQTKQELDKKFEERMMEQQKKYEESIKSIKSQIATTESEKASQAEAVAKLEKQLDDQKKRDMARAKAERVRLQKLADEKKKQEEADDAKAKKEEADRIKKEEGDRLKKEAAIKKQQIEAKKVKPGDTIALSDATVKPEEIRKRKDVPSGMLKRRYKGRSFSIPSTILIDENGDVIKVKMFGGAPKDVKSFVKRSLKGRKYTPAQKDNIKVKVWFTVAYRLSL